MVHKLLIYLILISGLIFVSSCNSQKKEEKFNKIINYFEKVHNYKLGNDINKIVIISEGKGCASCEKAFAKTALEYLVDSTVFLVTATGNHIDIQPFLQLERNCFVDWQLNATEYSEFVSSRVIYLKNNEIDTVIIINSNEIMQQLEFIRK